MTDEQREQEEAIFHNLEHAVDNDVLYAEQTRMVVSPFSLKALWCKLTWHNIQPIKGFESSEYKYCTKCGACERPEPEFPNKAWRDQVNGLIMARRKARDSFKKSVHAMKAANEDENGPACVTYETYDTGRVGESADERAIRLAYIKESMRLHGMPDDMYEKMLSEGSLYPHEKLIGDDSGLSNASNIPGFLNDPVEGSGDDES